MNRGETWLETVARARRMRPDQYREWMFIVGDNGTDEERCERGQQALAMMNRSRVGPSEVKDAKVS